MHHPTDHHLPVKLLAAFLTPTAHRPARTTDTPASRDRGHGHAHRQADPSSRDGRDPGCPAATPDAAAHRDVLGSRLARLDAERATGSVPVVGGGRHLAHLRHHLDDAGLNVEQWRDRWEWVRRSLTADGESDKRLGNETIRWDPDTGDLEVRVPTPLAHLANTGHGRYRVSCQVSFPHRGGEVWGATLFGVGRGLVRHGRCHYVA